MILQADFVLVCLSPFYLQEMKYADKNANNPGMPSSHRPSQEVLHAPEIYQLMVKEYQRDNTRGDQARSSRSRFVPLYMDGGNCEKGPAWLTGNLSYMWPSQYKDVLWMLTKPEERIKLKSISQSSSPASSISSNGMVH